MTISGRTQILQRQAQRSTSLTDVERTAMLDGLTVTLTTLRHLVAGLQSRG